MSEKSQDLQRTGMLLVTGPSAIYAQPRDSSRYVESVISIRWRSAQCEQWRSVRIYCDGNGDEVEGFLKPLARFATWDRKTALEVRPPALTSVRIELSEFPFDSTDIEDRVVALQTEVDRAMISSYGLGTRRDYGDFPDVTGGYLFVDLVSGHQDVSRSAWISEAPRLNRAAEDLSEALRRHSTPVDRAKWLEAYDWSPDELADRKGWEWDGSTP
jgi:hypothetical protein